MRRFVTATAALIVLAAVPAHAASAAQGTMKTCSATWSAKTDADKKATTYRAFMSTCMKGSGTTSASGRTGTSEYNGCRPSSNRPHPRRAALPCRHAPQAGKQRAIPQKNDDV
ncbi:MAG: hypothetical protein WDM89_12105 [Rhizomicrobium sp.]